MIKRDNVDIDFSKFKKNFSGIKKVVKWILIFWIASFIIQMFFKFMITIPSGNVGVRTLFGKVNNDELAEGLNFVNPLEKVTKMSIQTKEYTMSKKAGGDQISALTNEGLSVDLDITVLYRLDPKMASEIYKKIGLNYENKIIRPEIRSIIREVISKYEAKDIYAEKRTEVSEKIKDMLFERLQKRGIFIERVLLRKVELPASLSSSIQKKLQAEQESQRLDFILEKEKKEAERKVIEATGQRDAQKIIDESLSNKYLQYLYIKELKERKGTIYVPVGQNGLPLMKNI